MQRLCHDDARSVGANSVDAKKKERWIRDIEGNGNGPGKTQARENSKGRREAAFLLALWGRAREEGTGGREAGPAALAPRWMDASFRAHKATEGNWPAGLATTGWAGERSKYHPRASRRGRYRHSRAGIGPLCVGVRPLRLLRQGDP